MDNYPTIKDIKPIKLDPNISEKGNVYTIDVEGLNLSELPIFYRKAGLISPGHFHKGESKSRNPEMLYMLKGKLKLKFEDMSGDKLELILSEGDGYTCPPFIYQSYEILEDSIFIEPRIDKYEDIPDTYDHQEFLKLKNG